MSALRPLLWKDARLARGYLIAAGAVLIAPHAFLAYTWARSGNHGGPDWDMSVHYAGLVAGIAAMIMGALLAGGSLATERTDRSAEFLAILPLTRWSQLLSKLAVVAGPAALLSLANPMIVADAVPHGLPAAGSPNAESLITLVCSGILVVGVAWSGSAVVSAAAALLLGLLSPFFVTCLFYAGAQMMNLLFASEIDIDVWFRAVFRLGSLGGGLIAACLGSWLFLRREAD